MVFCTVYALILPAITMEKGACEIPEHTHSEACYTQVTSATRTEPVCTIESLNLHQHDDTCYDSEGNLTCGYADFVVHQHDSACYDENGNLWCPLPEIETHEHTGSCYAVPEADAPEVHTHTDDCYTVERDELTCTEHVHTDDCYTETSTLICSLEESDGHQHSDDCYAWNKVLTCDLSTEPAEVATEPVLVCGKAEILLHEHTAGCLEESGNLICGKIQVLEHQHTDACFETVEEPADTEALTCTLPEDEKHTHTALCYGTWELTCDMEEHTHTEECSTAEETDKTEVAEETTEPEEEMSGMEIDPSLPVMGTAYASGAKTRAYSVMTLDADTTGATNPVSVENYITGATLYYRTNENGEWTDVSGATDIPGNADFKLVISYGNVPIDDLLAAGGKMTYTLPDLLRNATANGSITSGSTTVGTITVANNTVTLAFDTTWLAKQKTETNTVISGDFFVEAEVNLSQVGEDRTAQIFIGKTTINIDFAGDIVAKYGNVDLSKTVSAISEETDGDYLTYTLTVKAGALGITFPVFQYPKPEPTEESKRKKKPKKAKAAKKPAKEKKPAEPRKKAKLTLNILCTILRGAGTLIRAVFGALRINHSRVCLGVRGEDPAAAARNYGKLQAWLYPVLGVLDRFIYLQFDELRIVPDFGSAVPTVEDRVSLRISARALFIVVAAVRVLAEFWREKVLDVFL